MWPGRAGRRMHARLEGVRPRRPPARTGMRDVADQYVTCPDGRTGICLPWRGSCKLWNGTYPCCAVWEAAGRQRKCGHDMTFAQGVLLFAIAIVAGALNSVAGGGSFFTFPTLVFTGVPPIQANATNTVALWPGTLASIGAYRKELGATPRPTLLLLGGVSLVGGLIGAIVLLHTPKDTFAALIPWLLLAATLLFAFGPRLTALVRARQGEKAGDMGMRPYGTALLQLVISIYGGFFGGGIGILMLAALGFMGMENIHEMNALKAVLNALINGIAVVAFVIAGAVFWAQALVMLVG